MSLTYTLNGYSSIVGLPSNGTTVQLNPVAGGTYTLTTTDNILIPGTTTFTVNGTPDFVYEGYTIIDGQNYLTVLNPSNGTYEVGGLDTTTSGVFIGSDPPPVFACYVTGTRIRTMRGEVAVEDLAVGDAVATLSGEFRPIRWIGNTTINCRDLPDPTPAFPIIVTSGAFGPGLPARDLGVSAAHAFYFDGALITAQELVNSSTIVRRQVETVTYWHVELESHDMLIAEGVLSESYLEIDNRDRFKVAWGEPAFSGTEANFCAPFADSTKLIGVRRYIWERARSIGWREVKDPALVLLADRLPVTPRSVSGGIFHYVIPTDAREVRLTSRASSPYDSVPEILDRRVLGVCIADLDLDNERLSLDDPRLSFGWHNVEDAGHRWTNGDAVLPLGTEIRFRLVASGHYPLVTRAPDPLSQKSQPAPAEQAQSPRLRVVAA